MISKNVTTTSEFKKKTKSAVFSIVAFVLVYLIILALAVVLTIACVIAGVSLIINFPRLITILLGLGLASLGFLVLFFLIKFLFKANKLDRSELIEIKRSDEPELFQIIQEIVDQVGTHFPKRIYISKDVNASVFYDSSFWSMFFPIKKNLIIGLGLVNTITKTELKAILAHEFGHFSQKTMKVGSYVYNVNHIIYNLLYDNDGYGNFISRWSSISGYISIFVVIAIKIVQGIQWILQKMYAIVNKSYLGLSREMEFHADEIAANVTGYQPLQSSLLRIDLANSSFESVLQFYSEKISEGKKSANIYSEQKFVMDTLATENNLEYKNKFPQVTLESISKFDKSKLVIDNQWASHPSVEDRIKRLSESGIESTDVDNSPANQLFSNIEDLQSRLTTKIFQNVPDNLQLSDISLDQFREEYKKQQEVFNYPSIYNGYYNNNNPEFFDYEKVSLEPLTNNNVSSFFSDEKVDLVFETFSLENDLITISQIEENLLPIKTFDYDGIKYKKEDSKRVKELINKKIRENKEQIKTNDIEIFKWFFKKESTSNHKANLIPLYQKLEQEIKKLDTRLTDLNHLKNGLDFLNYNLDIEEAQRNFSSLRKFENLLKDHINVILTDPLFEPLLKEHQKETFRNYTAKELQYLGHSSYNQENLAILFDAVGLFESIIPNSVFATKKELLAYQEQLVG